MKILKPNTNRDNQEERNQFMQVQLTKHQWRNTQGNGP